MNPLQYFGSHAVVNAIGWSLVHFLWQGAILSALLYSGLLLLRKRSPAVRYVAACTGLIAMALCPLATVGIMLGYQAPNGTPMAALRQLHDPADGSTLLTAASGSFGTKTPRNAALLQDGPNAAPEATPTKPDFVRSRAAHAVMLSSRLLSRVVWLWLTGVLLLSLRLVVGLIGLSRLRRSNTLPASPLLQQRVTELAQQMGIRSKVILLELARVQVPAVVGSIRSVILAPACILTGLPIAQLEAILAHELAHIRRHDSLINLIQVAIETVLFYHPAVWWVSHRIRVEREHCCDDLAIATLGDRITYARALTALEELRGASAQLALAATGGDLLARVRYVLGRRSTTFAPSPATTAGVVSMLLCTALGLAAFRPAQSSPHQPHLTGRESASGRSHDANARQGEVTSFVSGVLRLTLSSLSGLVTADSAPDNQPRNQAIDRATLNGSSGLARSVASLETVALQSVDPNPTPPKRTEAQSPDNTTDAQGDDKRSAGAKQSGAEAPQNHQADAQGVNQDSPSVPQPGHDVQQEQRDADQEQRIADQEQRVTDQKQRDADQEQRDADRADLDSAGAELDTLDHEIEALGRQMDNQALTSQQRAALAARISRLGRELGSHLAGDISSHVHSALEQSMRQLRGGLQAQIDQALRQADTAVRRAMQQADVASNVSRALRNAHIDERVNRALRDAHIDQQVQRAMSDAHVEDQVRRALRDAHIDQQVQRAMREVHVAEQVQRSMQDAHISEQIQRALRDAHITDQIQRAMQDAHITDQVSRALKQASVEIERAMKQVNIQIDRSTGNRESSDRDHNAPPDPDDDH